MNVTFASPDHKEYGFKPQHDTTRKFKLDEIYTVSSTKMDVFIYQEILTKQPFYDLNSVVENKKTKVKKSTRIFLFGLGVAIFSSIVSGFALVADSRAASSTAAFVLVLGFALALLWLEAVDLERRQKPVN